MEKVLYLQVNAGLGNRIRALVSGVCWAEKLCRRLVICWSVNPECAAEFSILFDGSGLCECVEIGTTEYEKTTQILSPEDAVNFFKGKDEYEALYIKSHGCFWSHNDITDKFKWIGVLRNLRPSFEVETLYTEWKSRDLVCRDVIHIRRTDNEKARRLSPISAFKNLIAEQDTNKKFTIVSDDLYAVLEMYEMFGERMRIPERIRQRNTREGMIEAAAVFFVLARSSQIFGSANSSFTEIARDHGFSQLTIVR